jgi:hypothetical protein
LTPIANILTIVQAKSVYEIPFLFEHKYQKSMDCGMFEVSVRDAVTKKAPSWASVQA